MMSMSTLFLPNRMLQETNAGSTRWLSGAVEVPFGDSDEAAAGERWGKATRLQDEATGADAKKER